MLVFIDDSGDPGFKIEKGSKNTLNYLKKLRNLKISGSLNKATLPPIQT